VTDLMLVTKMSSNIHLICPITMKQIELNAAKYFSNPLTTLMTQPDLVTFVVLNIEGLDLTSSNRSPQTIFSSAMSVLSTESFSHSYALVDVEVDFLHHLNILTEYLII